MNLAGFAAHKKVDFTALLNLLDSSVIMWQDKTHRTLPVSKDGAPFGKLFRFKHWQFDCNVFRRFRISSDVASHMWKWTTLNSFKWSDTSQTPTAVWDVEQKQKSMESKVKGAHPPSRQLSRLSVLLYVLLLVGTSGNITWAKSTYSVRDHRNLGFCCGTSGRDQTLGFHGAFSLSASRERDNVMYLYQWQMVQKFRDTRLDPGVLPTRNPGLWTMEVKTA